jgi:predicted methyltransferase
MAIVKHLVIDQGSDFTVSIIISDINDDPLNLTGYTGRAQMRKSYGSNTYYEFDVTFDADRTTGEITLSMASEDTTDLRAGRYVYDVEIVSGSGFVTRVLEGIVTVTPEVTR